MTEHEVSNDIDSIRAWADRMRPRAEVAALLDAGGRRADVARVDVLLAEIDRLRKIEDAARAVVDAIHKDGFPGRPGRRVATRYGTLASLLDQKEQST